jgi:hypothetical protein
LQGHSVKIGSAARLMAIEYQEYRFELRHVIVGHVSIMLSVLSNDLLMTSDWIFLCHAKIEVVIFAAPQCLVESIHRQ